jgi:aspartate aminotransferase
MINQSNPNVFAQQIKQAIASMESFLWFTNESPYARLVDKPGVFDFALENPDEMPLPHSDKLFKNWRPPPNKEWLAYKPNELASKEIIADALRYRLGVSFSPEDIQMTNGAFAAISVALKALIDPGDEVLYISPPWFFYKPMIVSHFGEPIRVPCNPDTYDLNPDAIARAITPRTRALILNTPNNPTGVIYPPATLQNLAAILEDASQRNRRPLYLLSDESYSRILYRGVEFHSPTEYYPNSLLIYTYGKTLLAPAQRIGYIAVPSSNPYREHLRTALTVAQIMTGYSFPDVLLQQALPELEKVEIDRDTLQQRRDRMISELRGMGYELNSPQATFYLLARSPIPDDLSFISLLGEEDILCLPGFTFEMPGFFRLALTANDEVIEQALPGFARAIARVRR